ncbi:hypothetical protein EMIT0111MI5_250044 [Burkholderia sp. IT-111MI5]
MINDPRAENPRRRRPRRHVRGRGQPYRTDAGSRQRADAAPRSRTRLRAVRPARPVGPSQRDGPSRARPGAGADPPVREPELDRARLAGRRARDDRRDRVGTERAAAGRAGRLSSPASRVPHARDTGAVDRAGQPRRCGRDRHGRDHPAAVFAAERPALDDARAGAVPADRAARREGQGLGRAARERAVRALRPRVVRRPPGRSVSAEDAHRGARHLRTRRARRDRQAGRERRRHRDRAADRRVPPLAGRRACDRPRTPHVSPRYRARASRAADDVGARATAGPVDRRGVAAAPAVAGGLSLAWRRRGRCGHERRCANTFNTANQFGSLNN